MTTGFNKAEIGGQLSWLLEFMKSNDISKRPCVFLSHKKEDKSECKKIAEYLSNAEIDYYLDDFDQDLQRAVLAGDPNLITESIKKGIRESSHMLVVVSEKTYKSHWFFFRDWLWTCCYN